MDDDEMVRVNWENQGNAVMRLMDTLFRTQTLVDCTLSGNESSYRVHKLLLSSCSPYFEKLILESPDDSHPILILDACDEDLRALIQYLYQGYTDIPKNNINRFLKIAMPVHCKGLQPNLDVEQPNVQSPSPSVANNLILTPRKKNEKQTSQPAAKRKKNPRKTNKKKIKGDNTIINESDKTEKEDRWAEQLSLVNAGHDSDDDVVIVEKESEVYVIDDEEEIEPVINESERPESDSSLVQTQSSGFIDVEGDIEDEPLTDNMLIEVIDNSQVLSSSINKIKSKKTSSLQARRQIYDKLDEVVQPLPDGRFKCIFCFYIKSSIGPVKNHIVKSHLDLILNSDIRSTVNLIKAFSCFRCGDKFYTVEKLQEHMTRKHSSLDEPNLTCSICSEAQPDLKTYRQHAKDVHSKNTQIVSLFCGRCGEKTNNSPFHTKTICDLMRQGKMPHKKVIRGDDDLKTAIMCDKCLQIFKKWNEFKNHYTLGCGGF